MANLTISAAGAAVGAYIGGPVGAQLGWMLGSYVSNRPEDIMQGTIGDLRVQTSQYGISIPVVFGRQRVSGNVIWAADKTTYEIRESSGGKGSGPDVVTNGYRISLAVAICQGPVVGVSRVWGDGELLVDSSTTPKPMPGILYSGSNDQLPDPTMEAAEGVGNVPAYRGLAYMVLKDFDLGVSGRIPNLSFEVLKA